jgi:prepilin-type N-terminal cleavage/methylation domain-containing protein
MRTTSRPQERGFTLVDLLAVLAIIATVSAIAVPTMLGTMERMRLGQSAREVERELQIAKSRAVVKGRPMRVRFDCPAAGQYRMVELIGTVSAPAPEDSSTSRCDETLFPYPAPDTDPLTRPNLDGPLRRLDESVSFGAAPAIEFRPDGTAFSEGGAGGWSLIPVAGVEIRLTRDEATSTITVNGLGKVQLQQNP